LKLLSWSSVNLNVIGLLISLNYADKILATECRRTGGMCTMKACFISSVVNTSFYLMQLILILLVFPAVLQVARPVNSYAATEEVSYLGKFGLRRSLYLGYMAFDVG
jgi:hypothetical protein